MNHIINVPNQWVNCHLATALPLLVFPSLPACLALQWSPIGWPIDLSIDRPAAYISNRLTAWASLVPAKTAGVGGGGGQLPNSTYECLTPLSSCVCVFVCDYYKTGARSRCQSLWQLNALTHTHTLRLAQHARQAKNSNAGSKKWSTHTRHTHTHTQTHTHIEFNTIMIKINYNRQTTRRDSPRPASNRTQLRWSQVAKLHKLKSK